MSDLLLRLRTIPDSFYEARLRMIIAADRIEALEAAREVDLRECAAQLDQNTATMDVARARIEALETALERIEALCSETDIINVLSAIARTALDKDAGR
jgi:ACT domain-containing protein